MHRQAILGLALGLGLLAGCGGQGGRPQENIQVQDDPLAEAKNTLTNYANGQPITSEAESFPDLVRRVKEKDPAKGEILEKGLEDLMKARNNPAAKAKELLKKL